MFLVCGLIPWTFFSNGLNVGLGALVGNGNLIKKVYFPRELLVVSTVTSVAVTLLIELGVLERDPAPLRQLRDPLDPGHPRFSWLLHVVFVLGIALVLSVVNVYFRDTAASCSRSSCKCSSTWPPIVYPIRYVPDTATVLGVTIPVGDLYRLNPIVVFVGAFRDVMYDLRWPALVDFVYLIGWAGGLLAFGMWVFSRLDRRLAEEV